MAELKIKGDTSGSVSLVAPTSGSDVSLTLPSTTMNLGSVLDSKLDLAGGKIIQVKSFNVKQEVYSTSSSYVASNLLLDIQPSSVSNKILVIAELYGLKWNTPSGAEQAQFELRRDSVSLADRVCVPIAQYSKDASFHFIDSPSTTSSITYQVYYRRLNGSGSIGFGWYGPDHSITLMEISA